MSVIRTCPSFVEDNPIFCHSERSEESLHFLENSNTGILRFAQDDSIGAFFRSLISPRSPTDGEIGPAESGGAEPSLIDFQALGEEGNTFGKAAGAQKLARKDILRVSPEGQKQRG